MAQARTEYGKVVAPRPLTGAELVTQRVDMFKFLMICMILFTIVSVFHVWSRCKLIDLNLRISETNRQLKDAEQEEKRLKLEAASLKTPARIETIAKSDLAMGLPTEQQVIVVK
ncbi:cell division protein FtsL [Geobacter sp. AOG2]|uniref:cell division protein FtsL n=1 Tax=Geobacter sp. AOG2 TaxID=1566347 RepID=UPI001CC541EA|nr:cell division protein FtsL [Geobacter sp. AOG2]GFE62370.1 cell division protein FtsL [Geobacter sp. AOG2]